MLRRKELIIDYLKIVLCAVLLALTYLLFVVPNRFAPAGINGVATMVQYKCGFSIGYFSLIINIPLCIFAFFKINKGFAVKSFVFSLTYSAAYLLLQLTDIGRFEYDANGVDTIFPCLIAGMLGGVVYGTCFRVNGSSGGTDIIAKYVSIKRPLMNFFWIIFALNAVVAFASLFVYTDIGADGKTIYDYKPVCLCIMYCFMSSFVGNSILRGSKTAYKFLIITPHADKLEEDILCKLHHSATRVTGYGIYSGNEKDVLVCVVNKHQIVDFKNILKNYPETFAFIETVDETVGRFDRVK